LHPEGKGQRNDVEDVRAFSLAEEPHVSEVVVFVSELISVSKSVAALLRQVATLAFMQLVKVESWANSSPEKLHLD
jgi:hypothetical protein